VKAWERDRERARLDRARELYGRFDELCDTADHESDPKLRDRLDVEIEQIWHDIMAERLPRPDPVEGRRGVRWPEVERGTIAQPFPCHYRVPAMLQVDLKRSVNRWEQECPRCGLFWRFIRRAGELDWEPIEELSDPNHEPTLPVDPWGPS
jgi:hypothetical protein